MRRLFAFLASAFAVATPALAAGDLLVAPTRVVLSGARGTEVILNNIGSEPATYRISAELKRMTKDGQLEDIDPATATPAETAMLSMISYAPRRIVLPPNQPQSVRIGIRPPEGLADGEYRAHLLFRAIPEAAPVVAETDKPREGVSIALRAIYGVSIPVIFRKGALEATAAVSNPRLVTTEDGPAFAITMARKGSRSVYGTIRVLRRGAEKPLLEARGVAIYPELGEREFLLPLPVEVARALPGPVTVEYREDLDAGGGLIAAVESVIR